MRYREYKGYTIVKDFVTNSYEIRRGGKNLCHTACRVDFKRLKDAKAFIDRFESGEIKNDNYRWF